MILRIVLRPSHRSFALLSQNILSRLLVIDLQAGKFRTIPAMKYRPAVCEALGHVGCDGGSALNLWETAVLLEEMYSTAKTSHANCHTTLTNRPARGRRGRFVKVVQQLACEVFARTAVCTVHMTAMRLKACHFHRQCRSPSPCPSNLATSLV